MAALINSCHDAADYIDSLERTNMKDDSIWMDAAYKLVREYGYAKAKQLCIQWRNDNSPGTASFAFHNATLKALERLATVGELTP